MSDIADLVTSHLGVIVFYAIFILMIPVILSSMNSSSNLLKYYMPFTLALANMLTLSGNKYFKNLYQLEPDNFIGFMSTNFIHLFTLIGVLWQMSHHIVSFNNTSTYGTMYGLVLFVIAFPFARRGMKFVFDNVDTYLKENTNIKFTNNWHLFVAGLLYILFLIGLLSLVLSIVDLSVKESKETVSSDAYNNKIRNRLSLSNATRLRNNNA